MSEHESTSLRAIVIIRFSFPPVTEVYQRAVRPAVTSNLAVYNDNANYPTHTHGKVKKIWYDTLWTDFFADIYCI